MIGGKESPSFTCNFQRLSLVPRMFKIEIENIKICDRNSIYVRGRGSINFWLKFNEMPKAESKFSTSFLVQETETPQPGRCMTLKNIFFSSSIIWKLSSVFECRFRLIKLSEVNLKFGIANYGAEEENFLSFCVDKNSCEKIKKRSIWEKKKTVVTWNNFNF